ncbi:hypothetical protein [Siminovitchia acidinfaciens]|uniref:hypothetical protein n=1 Tax=Siminovitchia acidinfaciens TaxID=2321395 RepID=UPI0013DF6721|nr:hypothetical protein [Siminovitchia acidinfaciens]
MKKHDQEQFRRLSKLNIKRKPKEEVLEWSPTGYGFISSVSHTETEVNSDDY